MRSPFFEPSQARHSHDLALASIARLTQYSCAHGLISADEEVREKSRRLAIDDILLSAITLRRIAELTKLAPRCKGLHVSLGELVSTPGHEKLVRRNTVNLWRLCGIIVHIQRINVYDERLILALSAAKDPVAMLGERGTDKPQWIEPVCSASSDRDTIHFFIADYAIRAAEILEMAREVWSEQGIHLYYDMLD